MANKDLINLGYSPDSGTGDSARRGGEKINNLFSDVYSQFGDNPVGQDPSQPFYGYRRPFFEYEYKVGELHPAGRFIPIEFSTSPDLAYDSDYGYGHDATGMLVDTDGDGIPDIYRDSEWYFLSRGEQIDADLTKIATGGAAHFVLPLASPGDKITVRDAYGTWGDGKTINVWTTPYDFQSTDQVQEWLTQTKQTDSPDSDTITIYNPVTSTYYKTNWHRVDAPAAVEAAYPKLSQAYSDRNHSSLMKWTNAERTQLEFLFLNYSRGWVVRQVVLDVADVSGMISNIEDKIREHDSDLAAGLYISADSDVRANVPFTTRMPDGTDAHGNFKIAGTANRIATSIISTQGTPLTDAGDGSIVQPYTQRLRVDLTDSVEIKDDLKVGNDLHIGHNISVNETFFVDSDRVEFIDSDGQSIFLISQTKLPTLHDERPLGAEEYTVTVNGNTVFGRDSDDVTVFNSRIMSNLIPYGDEVYSLGDSDNKWRDLYLSGSTIHLGSVKISEVNGTIAFRDSDDVLIPMSISTMSASTVNVDSELTVGGNAHVDGKLTVMEHVHFDSDVTILGSLTVNGTTTYVNTTNLEVTDNFIVLNKNQAAPFNDIGLIFQRFDSDSVDDASWNATIQFDELTDSFQFGETGSSGITTNPGISNVWLKVAEDSITATSTIIADSDIVVAGTLAIPGYNSVTKRMQETDSDILYLQTLIDGGTF